MLYYIYQCPFYHVIKIIYVSNLVMYQTCFKSPLNLFFNISFFSNLTVSVGRLPSKVPPYLCVLRPPSNMCLVVINIFQLVVRNILYIYCAPRVQGMKSSSDIFLDPPATFFLAMIKEKILFLSINY